MTAMAPILARFRSWASATAWSTCSASVAIGHGRRPSGRSGAGDGVRAWSRNSTLPAGPVMGDGMAPMMSAPAARQRAGHLEQGPAVDVGVPDDPSAPRRLDPSGLELGLDQDDHGAPGAATSPTSTGTARVHRDEREVGRHHVHRRPPHGVAGSPPGCRGARGLSTRGSSRSRGGAGRGPRPPPPPRPPRPGAGSR